MGLSAAGIGSGLDVKSLVDALVKAEITPLQTRHDQKVKDANTSLSAIGQLKSYLSNFQTTLAKFSNLESIYSMQSTVSDPDYLSTTIGENAVKGTYQVEIQKLAQQHSLASSPIVNTGSGTLTIAFGTYNADKTSFTANPNASSVTINITAGNDSLETVRDTINNTHSNVTASIITDSTGARLTLTSKQTGENMAMKITGTIGSLQYDPTNNNAVLTETVVAQNSVVKINGLTITNTTNQLSDSISGLTLNLKKAELGKLITLNIDENKGQFTSLINEFVKSYNDTITFLYNLTGYNSETKAGGVFQGDPQFRNLKTNITKWATSPLNQSNNSITSLADIGIKTNKQGLLEVNQTEFTNALNNHYSDIGALFAKTAVSSDTGISVKSYNPSLSAGTYPVSLTQYTPGVSLAGTIGNIQATSTDGITLTGTGTLSGLSLQVLSGSTGNRGNITVTDGIAVQLNQLLDTYMKSNGDLAERSEQLNITLKHLSDDQEAIVAKSTALQNRYNKQFSALDALLTSLQSTSNFLTQQIANLPQNKSK